MTTTDIPDGLIDVDHAPAHWLFTSDRWHGSSYLWKCGDRITFSFLCVKDRGKGTLSALRRAVEADGYECAVPTPSGHMTAILKKWGFKRTWEWDKEMHIKVEVWVNE